MDGSKLDLGVYVDFGNGSESDAKDPGSSSKSKAKRLRDEEGSPYKSPVRRGKA